MINPDHLLELRTRRGFSQRRLAALAGLNHMCVTRLEAGADPSELTLAHLQNLARALGVSAAELLNGGVQPTQRADDAGADDESPLDFASAHLIRRIQRREDVRRKLSRSDRCSTLPALISRGLITTCPGGFNLTEELATALELPTPTSDQSHSTGANETEPATY